jgi:signal peptidase I
MARDRERTVVREYFEALLVAALFLGFTNTFVLKTFYIPSGSMEDTLLVGDHLIVNRWIFGSAGHAWETRLLPQRPLRRGDVVIFRSPEAPRVDLVKRCAALPGDRVEMLQKQLYVNGSRVDEHLYVKHEDLKVAVRRTPFNQQLYMRDNFGPLTVPEGHYLFLGDNRDSSYDSRFWGPVPEHYIKGRAAIIYWSYGGETPDGTWPGWWAKVGQIGRTALGFFTNTRWRRTLKLVH